MTPRAQTMILPDGYGNPQRTLAWDDVFQRLLRANHYWLATTRPDGRPHVVPVDGVWLNGTWYFGGHADTVHQRNLRMYQEVAVHLEDAVRVVIVEGRAQWIAPDSVMTRRLSAVSKAKYGYAPPPGAYRDGVWGLAPRRVLAWDSIGEDPTRFSFE